jgi:hypothetical protein
VAGWYEKKMQQVENIFQRQQYLYFTTDRWESANRKNNLRITCYYIEEEMFIPGQVTIGF